MTIRFQLFAALLAGGLICSSVGAQTRNGTSSGQQSPGHTRAAARPPANPPPAANTGSPSNQQGAVIRILPGGRILSGIDPIANTVSLDGVPGLGFDYPHLAAISGASHNNPAHFGHNGHRGQGSFVPILFGGYPYYSDGISYDQPEQQPVQQVMPQPQIIVIQQPLPVQQYAGPRGDVGNLPAATLTPQTPVPVPDIGDFILVRRDGRVLFASAFSVVGAQLQYVTPEGVRRAVALTDLDVGATKEMNEARGTTVQIHN